MTTIRVEKRHRYTAIDRGALNDKRLSFRARGILAYLLDKPDDWKTNADAVAEAGKEGREAVRTALTELETVGYLERRKWRNEQGQWQSEWIVLERPKGTEPRRETSAGYPRRVPGPQLLKTETETEVSDRVSLNPTDPVPEPDPNCTWCRGSGLRYNATGGFDVPCSCCDPRPRVASESTVEVDA